jgi:NAD-dependent deacetylase
LEIPIDLVQRIKTSQKIAVLTGAGFSAESGIPTFREAQTGLWAQYNPEELATPQAFQADPDLVWRWYQWRREIIQKSEPNPGHHALVTIAARLEASGKTFWLITQNVDGLHQRAGNKRVVELHGNIHRSKCFDCGFPGDENSSADQELPRCQECNGLLRPDVVWFGEGLPLQALDKAWNAAQNCDLFFSIGTSALVQPAASLPAVALQNGSEVIEINPDITQLSNLATYHLQGASGKVLPEIVKAVWA